jgi:hypothetical protein
LPDPDAKASEKAGSGYHSTVSRSLLIVVAAGCTVAIQGCRPADPRSRDSAGIRIVENPSRRTAPVAFRLGQVAFDVGGLDTNQDNEFNPRQGQMRAAVMSSGHFAVTDVNRIHIFDETGKRLRIVGRSGRGPEEFGNIVSICRARGDTLVVGDAPNGRVAILDSAGRFVRTIPTIAHGYPAFDACFDDGSFLLETIHSTPAAAMHLWTRVSLDGKTAIASDTVRAARYDLATEREAIAAARGSEILFSDAVESEIQVRSSAGTLVALIRTDDPPRPITDESFEAEWRKARSRRMTPAQVDEAWTRARHMPHPATWPAWGRFHVDAERRIWIQDYVMNMHITRHGWSVLSPDGRLLGRLEMPQPLPDESPEVIGFGSDLMLLRRRDSDGALHVTGYRIEAVR